VRLLLQHGAETLKIELVNDVPAHTGQIEQHPTWGQVDSAENILANKITAVLGREEPKDLADIWGFCCQMDLSLTEALENAHSKAAGVFAPDLARALFGVSRADWQVVRWINPPDADKFVTDLRQLAERLLL
jgi:predicted nucleotidyltransferase component of viral defense system